MLPSADDSLPLVAYGTLPVADSLIIGYGYDAVGQDSSRSLNAIWLQKYWAGEQPYGLDSQLNGSVNWMLASGDTLYAGGSFTGTFTNGIYHPLPGRVARWIRSNSVSRKSRQPAVRLATRSGEAVLIKSASDFFAVRCLDVMGRHLATIEAPQGLTDVSLPVQDWPVGIYILHVEHPTHSQSLRWIKF